MVQKDVKPKKRRKRVDTRATIGFDSITYSHLQNIADAKNTPIAHIVREAVAEYLADQTKPANKSSKRSV